MKKFIFSFLILMMSVSIQGEDAMVKKSIKTKRVVIEQSKEKVEKKSTEIQVLKDFMGSIEVGEPIVYKSLNVFPIFNTVTVVKSYKKLIVIKEALEMGILEINDTGTVSKLEFNNKSKDVSILIIEGEVVKGGKQNRVVNLTFILGPKSKKEVPTSCIEQHRWTTGLGTFKDSNAYVGYDTRANLRSSVSRTMSSSGGTNYASNQGSVWSAVSNTLCSADASNTNANFLNVYSVNEEEISKILKKIKDEIKEDDDLTGLVCVNNKKIFAEIFDDHDFLSMQINKIFKSSIIEYLKDKEAKTSINTDEVITIMNKIVNIEKLEVFATPDKGKNGRFSIIEPKLEGTVLFYNGNVVHISLISG